MWIVFLKILCEDINECLTENGDCEQECYNIPSSRVCDCYYGYYPNDNLCTDIDECESNNGDCEHSCTNTEGSY